MDLRALSVEPATARAFLPSYPLRKPVSLTVKAALHGDVAESDLQPGDLVFYYSPISHVGMYIGNGMIVNAENPSAGVKVTSLHSMPYVGAVRPG